MKQFRALLRDDRGQGLVEYALIIALISIVAIAALTTLGKNANSVLNSAAGTLAG
ncbi:MAG: Flp family type IVb pilin [Vulcanimicrobiaceae bacterium]